MRWMLLMPFPIANVSQDAGGERKRRILSFDIQIGEKPPSPLPSLYPSRVVTSQDSGRWGYGVRYLLLTYKVVFRTERWVVKNRWGGDGRREKDCYGSRMFLFLCVRARVFVLHRWSCKDWLDLGTSKVRRPWFNAKREASLMRWSFGLYYPVRSTYYVLTTRSLHTP